MRAPRAALSKRFNEMAPLEWLGMLPERTVK
jgi:hypothetical protein